MAYELPDTGLRLEGTILSLRHKEAVVADYDLSALSDVNLRIVRSGGDWFALVLFLSLLALSLVGLVRWAVPARSVAGIVLCGIGALFSLLLTAFGIQSRTCTLILKGPHGETEVEIKEARDKAEAFFGEMRELAAKASLRAGFRILR